MKTNTSMRNAECGMRNEKIHLPHLARRRPHGSWGFTLIELMTVVVIVGILAGLAIPQYTRTIERARWRQAQTLLMAIYHGERAFFFANNAYQAASVPADWAKINMDNPNLASIPVAYTVDTGGCGAPPPCFVATADRGGGVNMTINQNRTYDLANWPMP